ncbi:MAG: VOC family protein [Bacteroidota bacterium]
MNYKTTSIRTFIGAKDFQLSKAFYNQLGFEEIPVGEKMSYFKVSEQMGFYLQDYYVKDWIENSMIFLEVDDLDACYQQLSNKELAERYTNVRFSKIKNEEWGREFFMHDPAGILWHFGSFQGVLSSK